MGRFERLDNAHPRVSVVVRSFNRLPMLAELLEALLRQDHDDFEIVVVEQSTDRSAYDVARLSLIARDPRVRILRHDPLGGPAARNAGVRAARGELLVFIDDDDLPATTDWLRRHEENFADPNCLGVTGQFVGEDGSPQPYANMDKARRHVLSFNLLKWQRVYARADRRKRVDSLMGSNAAIRRSTLERFGLWDECTPIEDEPSLAYRIGAGKHRDEYLLFDPAPKMIRRLDVPGGMAKRSLSGPAYAKRTFAFLHNIIGHYFPTRFVLLYPIYFVFVGYHVTEWICSDSRKHRTWSRRVGALAALYLTLPPLWIAWLAGWGYRRVRDGEPVRRPELAPALAIEDSGERLSAPQLAPIGAVQSRSWFTMTRR
jgi:glycosyltransferase involved in cell wall biosynthesis